MGLSWRDGVLVVAGVFAGGIGAILGARVRDGEQREEPARAPKRVRAVIAIPPGFATGVIREAPSITSRKLALLPPGSPVVALITDPHGWAQVEGDHEGHHFSGWAHTNILSIANVTKGQDP